VSRVTLLEKAYGSFSNRAFETVLSSLLGALRVKTRVTGTTNRNWIQIDIIGEDEAVALKILDKEIGLAPTSAKNVSRFSVFRGKIVGSLESDIWLHVDIGVVEPKVLEAAVSLKHLQAQLCDGKKLPLQRIIEVFCLFDFAPLRIRITSDLKIEEGFWEAELAESQLSVFSEWLESNLDRLIVLGAGRSEVEVAADRAHHMRDVIGTETLGPYEHAVLCKLGTQAVGLIPRLGPYLHAANLAPLSPRRIKQLLEK